MATTRIKPPYELTVYDFFVHFDADDNGNEALDLQLPVVKSIGVKPGEQKQTIHASVSSMIRSARLLNRR